MIVATPLGGGHYLVDILAGVAVSTWRLSSRQPSVQPAQQAAS
ncbi:hypothetical protein [Pseudomonas sp. GW460-C3]